MPGAIVGVFGKQRSGKTLFAYSLTKYLVKQHIKATGKLLRVYSNIYTDEPEFKYVNSINQIPLDLDPKIILIDEIYHGCDAQDYKKLKEMSIFINTIGKQNCFFIFTSIQTGEVYNRIRNQMDLCVLVTKDTNNIYYRLLFMNNNKTLDYKVVKNADFFSEIHYDTNFIPREFDWSMKSWSTKLDTYYKTYYPNILT